MLWSQQLKEWYLTSGYIPTYRRSLLHLYLHSILETETPALEGSQGDQAESEHLSGGVRQQMQCSKLTFSKSRLLATFNCKMVAIKKIQSPKKKS